MIHCPKCNALFDEKGKWGVNTFCSQVCANSRVHSQGTKDKIRESLAGRKTTRSPSPDKIGSWRKAIRDTRLKKYKDTPFEELGSENRRRRVFEEQNYCCANKECGISEWFGKKISLELEHKDGNNKNNLRENLEGLCPNCHSNTDTWRGRNKLFKTDAVDITDEFLLQCLKDTDNIRQGLLKAGIAAKGSNYARAKKILGGLNSNG